MYSSNDLERFFLRYKAEAESRGISTQQFCLDNNVPYNLFLKWYKDTRHKIVPVDVELPVASSLSPLPVQEVQAEVSSLRILVDIRMTNGIHIRQRNLDYSGLRRLVEKLEVLC